MNLWLSSNTVSNPIAVVVEIAHAVVANFAVRGPRQTPDLAGCAILQVLDALILHE